MFAPIFKTLSTPAIQAIAGSRIYSSGMAPQNALAPYITWFVVTGDPYRNLSSAPDGDSDTIQIDCWAGPENSQELIVVNLARAVRDALDAAGQANRIIINTREADTMLFRIGLQTEFIHNR